MEVPKARARRRGTKRRSTKEKRSEDGTPQFGGPGLCPGKFLEFYMEICIFGCYFSNRLPIAQQ